MNEKLPQLLAARLAQPLPGPMVGSRYEPHPRPSEKKGTGPICRNGPRPTFGRCPAPHKLDLSPFSPPQPAAVLLLLYPHEGQWRLPLTLRPPHLATHAGQVSLPGGAVEPGETTAEAAIREFHEELGDDGRPIDLLGTLSPLYVQVSNYLVVPWVAVARSRPRFVPNPAEVEEVLEVPLPHLLDPAQFGSHVRQHEGRVYSAPHFLFQSHRIWGATCMILGELVTVLEEMQIEDC